ncbi:MAG: AbrB/MazE/SpoVT family DNA-binding domain-containing protein [Candidatus Daviesbacteria bacterium]|nr:AbrB/MazE/SpoVT family DNA-binding domain-containing protein [Candidatus Daviesbacteria bacterium]
MYQVTVGSKYQIVIPKDIRNKVNGLRPGKKVGIYMSKGEVTIKPEPENWLKRTRGMMKEAWKGIDTTKYLEDLRNEWDKKS